MAVQTISTLNLRALGKPALFKEAAHKDATSIMLGKLFGIAERVATRTDQISGDTALGLSGYFEVERAYPVKAKVDGAEQNCTSTISNRLFMPSALHDMLSAKMDELGKPATEKSPAKPATIEFAYTVTLNKDGTWDLGVVIEPRVADPLSAMRATVAAHGKQRRAA